MCTQRLRVQDLSSAWLVLWVERICGSSPLVSQNVTFSWRWGLYIGHQVKVSLLGWALLQYGWYPHKKGELWTQTCTKRRWYEDTGRTRLSISQGERPGTDSFSQSSEATNPCQPLNCRILATRTVRQSMSIVEASQVVALSHSSPSKIIQSLVLIVKQRHSKIH